MERPAPIGQASGRDNRDLLDNTHRIDKIDFLLSALTDEYTKFISKRRIQESDRSTEDLLENFPLHL